MKLLTVSLFIITCLVGCKTINTKNDSSTGQQQAETDEIIAITTDGADQKALALFDEIYETYVSLSPVEQTYLGRKTNQDKWDDLSEEQSQIYLALDKQHLKQLLQIKPDQLSPQVRLSYELQKSGLEKSISGFKWRHYGYPINQMFGTHSHVPSLLINQHSITTAKDAEDYIARLNGVPQLFAQQITDLKIRESMGIIPPKFVFEHVIRDCKNLLKGKPFSDQDTLFTGTSRQENSTLLNDFTQKLAKTDLSEDKKIELTQSAELALTQSLKPAYENLINYLTHLEQSAKVEGGAWRMPKGDDYYNFALSRTTTTDLTADQIHNIGLNDVARIHGEMKQIMAQVNFDGNLAEFFEFMRSDPQFTYDESDHGKAQYLSETSALIGAMQQALPNFFQTLPKAELKVKAVEPFREKSAGKAFYEPPAVDDSRPGIYYVNLYSLKNMPWYQMEALAYHEALPGHHMQIAIAQELTDLPKFRKYGGYTAYSEGWGLYAELLGKDMGFYTNPYSDFGRLSMELWRACRLVVDSGLHAKRWSKQRAINYLMANTPNPKHDIERAVERYLVMPSQATAYKIGMIKILELREMAKTKLGDTFDIREFHDVILKDGALPLNVLEQQVNNWLIQKN